MSSAPNVKSGPLAGLRVIELVSLGVDTVLLAGVTATRRRTSPTCSTSRPSTRRSCRSRTDRAPRYFTRFTHAPGQWVGVRFSSDSLNGQAGAGRTSSKLLFSATKSRAARVGLSVIQPGIPRGAS